jgi:hypothetical protein
VLQWLSEERGLVFDQSHYEAQQPGIEALCSEIKSALRAELICLVIRLKSIHAGRKALLFLLKA